MNSFCIPVQNKEQHNGVDVWSSLSAIARIGFHSSSIQRAMADTVNLIFELFYPLLSAPSGRRVRFFFSVRLRCVRLFLSLLRPAIEWSLPLLLPSPPAGSSSCGGDVTVYVLDINQPSLPTLFILFLYLFRLYGPFNCIPFHKFSRQLSASSLCSSGLISALLVLSTIYISLWKSPSALI